jgi:hypothetical protein
MLTSSITTCPFTRFQPPRHKVTRLTSPNELELDSVHLFFQTFPSCSRNPGLFGCVDPVLGEA